MASVVWAASAGRPGVARPLNARLVNAGSRATAVLVTAVLVTAVLVTAWVVPVVGEVCCQATGRSVRTNACPGRTFSKL